MALTAYRQALDINPESEQVATKISEIEELMSQLAEKQKAEEEQRKRDEQYRALIARADELSSAKEYQSAIDVYAQALELKPEETYPGQQIEKLRTMMKKEAELAKKQQEEKETEAAYNLAMAEAEEAARADLLEKARSGYQRALEIKPGDALAKSKLAEIERRIAEKERSREEEERRMQLAAQERAKQLATYKQHMQEARQARDKNKLQDALESYRLAAGIFPDSAAPKKQIQAIESLFAESEKQAQILNQQRKEAEKRAAIEEQMKMANAYMDSEDYERAKDGFAKALEIIPDDENAKNLFEQANKLLAERQRKVAEIENQRAEYNKLIASGNEAIKTKTWDKAREFFNRASELFPEEEYPKSRLKEIDRLEEEQAEEERLAAYAKAISDADKLFLTEYYLQAKELYTKALEHKPQDEHALKRLERIEQLLASSGSETAQEQPIVEKKIVEETYQEGRSTVTIRRVIVGNKEDVYKRVVHSWGGKYYFLNDRSISETIWKRDTEN